MPQLIIKLNTFLGNDFREVREGETGRREEKKRELELESERGRRKKGDRDTEREKKR